MSDSILGGYGRSVVEIANWNPASEKEYDMSGRVEPRYCHHVTFNASRMGDMGRPNMILLPKKSNH